MHADCSPMVHTELIGYVLVARTGIVVNSPIARPDAREKLLFGPGRLLRLAVREAEHWSEDLFSSLVSVCSAGHCIRGSSLLLQTCFSGIQMPYSFQQPCFPCRNTIKLFRRFLLRKITILSLLLALYCSYTLL